MAVIQNANSILELAFGVNLVGLAVGQRFVLARESVVATLRRRIVDVDAAFAIAPGDEALFNAFAANSSTALRWASAVRPLPQILSAAVVFASVLGLYVSAMKPDREVSEPLVFWFATVSLVVLPLTYAFYQRLLDLIVDRVGRKQLRDDSTVQRLASRFRAVRTLVHIGDKGAEIVLEQYGAFNPITIWFTKRLVRRMAIEIGKGDSLDFLWSRPKAAASRSPDERSGR